MKLKATLRKSGYRMVTVRPAFHVGIDNVINALLYHTTVYGEALPATRSAAWKLTIDTLVTRGTDYFAEGEDVDAARDEVTKLAESLFPELAEEVRKV